MRKIILLVLCAGAVMAVWADSAQAAVADKVIRLHVVANSDSPADQAAKLEARDRVLARVAELTGEARGAESAAEAIGAELASIAAAAGPNARAELSRKTFSTRDYGVFALPAGSYTALTVTLGEGRGRNWWCVVFPPLCQAAGAEEFQAAAAQAGLTDRDVAFLTGKGEETVVIKFKTLELINKVFSSPSGA